MNANEVFGILNKHILADGFPMIMDMENSKGSWVIDQRDGKSYLDMFTMYASASIGYNHPHLLANKDLLGTVAINKPTISDIYNTHYAQFIETFSRVGIPEFLPHAFFVSGGALAVENALKTAFDWKVRKNMEKGIEGRGRQVIHFKEAFHGRSGYTMSLTNTDPVKTMYFPQWEWPRIVNPKLHFPLTEESLEKTMAVEQEAIKQIHEAIAAHPDDIACMIIEPIQGEGGDNHFRNEFLIELRNICDREDIILIFDEVQTGVGITGKFWCFEHFDVRPDIIAFGKKAQVCGMLASDRILEVKDNVFEMSSRINSTFGGNLIDIVRFRLILEVIENEGLVEHADRMGKILHQLLIELQEESPDLISNVRGKGLYAAFDLPNGDLRNQLRTEMIQEQVIILGAGDCSIRFRPHLNVTEEELALVVSKLKMCIPRLSVAENA